ELRESRLGVGGIGQAHRGVRVTETPPWAERHSAGQIRELADDVADMRPDEKIVVEIAPLDLGVPVETVIVVVLATQIKGGWREGVVIQPVRNRRPTVAHQHEWPVLVEGI